MDLSGQLQANNRQIDSLLNIVDNLQYENRQLTRRMEERRPERRNSEVYRNSRGATGRAPPNRARNVRPTGETGPGGNATEEDVVFYFYLPRRDDESEVLTEETITQATTRSFFNEIENPNNLSCPITLEVFLPHQPVIMINQCRHIFNAEHLSRWFETKSTCPMCRCNIQPTPPLNRLATMATQMLSNVFTTGVNDILNDLHI